MNNSLTPILKDADLYGFAVVAAALKKQFNFYCFREKTIPTSGSPCRRTEHLKEDAPVKVLKAIAHRTGDVTIVTDKGFLKFVNL